MKSNNILNYVIRKMPPGKTWSGKIPQENYPQENLPPNPLYPTPENYPPYEIFCEFFLSLIFIFV